MTDKLIKFKFKSSYDGAADYEIVRYGHPDHGKRVTVRHTAFPLYQAGQRRYNYTIGKYMHYRVRVCGYLASASGYLTLTPEYATAFDKWARENHRISAERWARKYSDKPWYFPSEPYARSIKGIANLVPCENGPYNYTWQRIRVWD